jgi:hypothetical protein
MLMTDAFREYTDSHDPCRIGRLMDVIYTGAVKTDGRQEKRDAICLIDL